MLRSFIYRTFLLLPLLLIPAVAMQFTQEVQWSIGDFLVMGVLLFCLGAGLDLLRQKIFSKPRRRIWTLVVVLFFLLLWAEMAVGIFNSPIAGD